MYKLEVGTFQTILLAIAIILLLQLSVVVFVSAWMYIGFICAFVFILIQLILMIDFAHNWNEIWYSITKFYINFVPCQFMYTAMYM